MHDTPTYILAIKPAPGCSGPLLVSDDQDLIQMVIEAIGRTYAPPIRRSLRIERSGEGVGRE